MVLNHQFQTWGNQVEELVELILFLSSGHGLHHEFSNFCLSAFFQLDVVHHIVGVI